MDSDVTLDNVIDFAMQLPPEQQEMLLEILYKRQIERRREEIELGVKESIASYREGNLKATGSKEIIEELRQSLVDEQ